MYKGKLIKNKSLLIVLFVTVVLLTGVFLPLTNAKSVKTPGGYSTGPSYTDVVPIEKVTFVGYDRDSLVDDYAYMASIPTAVFKNKNTLYSNPLLFFEDEYKYEEDRERSLNARQGLDYFMDDWMGYCNGRIDQMTMINVPKTKLDSNWKSKKSTYIDGENPYDLASQIALNDWSYSDKAVIAAVGDDGKLAEPVSGEISGELAANDIEERRFTFPQINIITPNFKDFIVPDGYKYMKARLWWPCFYFSLNPPGFFNIINVTIPPGDPNLELFCRYNDNWMQSGATLGWNQKFGMDVDYTASYIYKPGQWRMAVTDVPTHDTEKSPEVHRKIGPIEFGRYGKLLEAIRNMREVNYYVDIEMFPGTEVEIPDVPMYGCGKTEFKLTWDNPDVTLGFSLIGPSGEEVLSVLNESREDNQVMHLEQLGECLEGESYSFCVFTMDNVEQPLEFNIEYSWEQKISKSKGNSLTSAAEGAVLGSTLNAPLLYTATDSLPSSTKKTLYKLGVKDIYLVDFDGNINKDTLDKIKDIANLKEHFCKLEEFYNFIQMDTGSNDVIFTTLDPWSYWYAGGRKPAGENAGEIHLGPAAYSAAHHGSPVLIVENHPRLSSSRVWHTEFWRRNAFDPVAPEALPSIAGMYMTGNRVYDFLEDNNFDKKGMESMIVVAGQFDIGIGWDRTFIGKATPGRFFGSPVDTSYWISRNVFYPALIFENPAMSSNGIELINGSKSIRKFPFWGKLGLKIVKPSEEETFRYPVMQTYLCYNHRFNERAADYWGWKYTTADGMVPGESTTFNSIDDGVCKKYYNKLGSFFPDFTDTETVPFYCEKAGFDNVYSTSPSAVTENLNKGVIMWIGKAHGGEKDSGVLKFWEPESSLLGGIPGLAYTKEENPWRGYEWYLGSTEEPDTLTMDVYGVLPAIIGNPTGEGLGNILPHPHLGSSLDWAPAKKPLLDLVGKIAGLPLINRISPDWLKDTQDYYDGVVGSVFLGTIHQTAITGYTLDEMLENLHSTTIVNGACLISLKYFHLTMIRHGSVVQTIDPWSTSWYTAWLNEIPRNLALGKTIGEGFTKGIRHVGIIPLEEQWWADNKQNVCLYGDPDLRVLTPNTEYSSTNYWTKEETQSLQYNENMNIAGHMPYGADKYPNEREPEQWLLTWIILLLVIVVVIALVIVARIKQKKK